MSRFISGYLLFCCAILVGLFLVDAVFPQARVYSRIKELLSQTLRAVPKP